MWNGRISGFLVGAGHARHPRVTDDLSLSLFATESGSLWMPVLGIAINVWTTFPVLVTLQLMITAATSRSSIVHLNSW